MAEDPIPFIYQPLTQNYSPNATLHVRGEGDAAGLAPAVRRMVLEIDPTLSVFNIRTLEEQVSQSLAPLRVNVVMLGSFGILALALASIGLYGVASYAVTQRTREIGVRMALGAEPSSVLRLVLGRGLLLVGAGIVVGMAAALAVSFAIPPDLLPNVSVRDPLTLDRHLCAADGSSARRELSPSPAGDADRSADRAADRIGTSSGRMRAACGARPANGSRPAPQAKLEHYIRCNQR